MTGTKPDGLQVPHNPPHYMILKVVTDVFQPNMQPACFAIYAVLARRFNFGPNPNNSLQELAIAANVSKATASRAIDTLVHLELIQRNRRGGSQSDSYTLLHAFEAAKKWGAVYTKQTVSYSLTPENAERLKASITAIQAKQRGKQAVTETQSSVSPERRQSFRGKRQRTTSETQTGLHLNTEERRKEEDPSPTPSRSGGTEGKAKTLPDKEKQDAALKAARDSFTGVMDDLAETLLDSNRPNLQHLANGSDDWEKFGFNSLGIVATERHGDALLLSLTADDPAAAARGLAKYGKRWEALCRKWFGCEVEVKWVQCAPRCAPVC